MCTQCASIYVEEVEFCGLDGAPLTTQDEDPLLGHELERYVVTGLLGVGGMGRVYKARHKHLERDYALKVLYGDLAANKGSVRRFKREAESAGRLDHPNVVTVHDFGQSAEGLFFLVMELVQGRTLRDALAEDGAFDRPRARHVIRQIVDGVKAAHDRGIVHRDLKPANIMLVDQEGPELVKIVDFGLAGVVEDDDVLKSKLTSTGSTLGTPAYMAPEQALGSKVTSAADMYSLGVVIYEMLSGKLPFASAGPDVLMQKMVATPPRLQGHGALGDVAAQLLIPIPDERPSDTTLVIDALEGRAPASDETPATDSEAPRQGHLGRWAALALLAGCAGVAGLWWTSQDRATTMAGEVAAADSGTPPSAATPVAVLDASPTPSIVHPDASAVARPDAGAKPKAPRPPPAARPRRPRRRVDAGAKPDAVASPAQPDPATRKEVIRELDRTLRRALDRRGLSMTELALVPGLAEPVQAWSTARRNAPALEATAKLQQLVAALRGAPVPLSVLEAKLDRIATGLDAASARAPAGLRALEDRYLDLSSRVASRPSAAVRGQLAKALTQLETAVQKL